ncbi:unnamed protein product [Paramecium sonneborni]|uniref:Uncharacterized protein n=1 Tax=Paramecium sonneborni TaxID=65129 RepID=A0A8S1LLV0_9CILI|nr:unnamed protein product [Paramecium sonneborni]
MKAYEQIIWKNKLENTQHHNNFNGSSRFCDQINMGLTSKCTCETSFGIDNLVIYYR